MFEPAVPSDAVLERRVSPEEAELQHKQHELASLQARLIELELDLGDQRRVLDVFAHECRRRLSRLWAESDRLSAEIASRLASDRLDDVDLQIAADAAHARADASSEDANALEGERPPPSEAPSEDARALFRRLYRLFAPLLASYDDPDEMAVRTDFTRRLIDVRLDVVAMQDLEAEWEGGQRAFEDAGSIARRLIDVIRAIAKTRATIAECQDDLAGLSTTHWWQLEQQADVLVKEGRDAFDVWETALHLKIAKLEATLREMEST